MAAQSPAHDNIDQPAATAEPLTPIKNGRSRRRTKRRQWATVSASQPAELIRRQPAQMEAALRRSGHRPTPADRAPAAGALGMAATSGRRKSFPVASGECCRDPLGNRCRCDAAKVYHLGLIPDRAGFIGPHQRDQLRQGGRLPKPWGRVRT